MPFKSLPNYFSGFPNDEFKSSEASGAGNHRELLNHKSWRELYDSMPEDTETHHYKLVVLARHGQGFHNACIERYGMDEWNKVHALLESDELGNHLVDSKLTPVGKKQVQNTGKTVLTPLVESLGMFPHAYFSSPMRRCLETFIESWTQCIHNNSTLSHRNQIDVKIFENIRETLGRHQCDKRVDHSTTVAEYQNFKLENTDKTVNWIYEPDYDESDQLWSATHRETEQEMDERLHRGLESVFKTLKTEDKFISITCHSGVIESTLRNFHHPAVIDLQTGDVVITVLQVNQKKLHQSTNTI